VAGGRAVEAGGRVYLGVLGREQRQRAAHAHAHHADLGARAGAHPPRAQLRCRLARVLQQITAWPEMGTSCELAQVCGGRSCHRRAEVAGCRSCRGGALAARWRRAEGRRRGRRALGAPVFRSQLAATSISSVASLKSMLSISCVKD